MEHYLCHIDYPIWQVIQNGNGLVYVKIDTNGMIKVLPPKTAEEVVAREGERKARTTLLMALPEDHLAKFHKMADAKEMFQTLLSQLEIHGAGVSHKDANQKFLRSLPSSWSQVALIIRTKPGLDTLSFDNLYNNLRVFERDVKGTTASSSSNTQNVAFVSADNTSSTNDINDDDLEDMDLKWQVAIISIRIKKFHKRTGRKLAKWNQDSRRRDGRYNGNKAKDNSRRPASQDDSKALVTIDEEAVDWSGHVEEDTQNFAMMAYSSSNSGNNMPSGPDVEIDYSKFTNGPKQTLADESDSKLVEYASSDSDSSVEPSTSVPEPVVNESKVVSEPQAVCKPKVWTDAPIIEEYESDIDDEMDDPHKTLKDKGIIDSGCSRHMTGNKAHLKDYQEFKGGSVAFRGSNGKITGKGKIKAGRLDFDDVYYVEELKHYNLFFVSHMCDKKNKVLFTDTDCLVLSPDFKLPDKNQVLLKIPRQHNMYNFNLKNIDPSRDLSCLFAKASIDESNKWHRRPGHVNFKNLNKLVKGNLVRGLPSKIFENDHTCVACQKGKQHKASCKAMTVKTIRSDNGTKFKNHALIELCGLKGIKREYSNARNPQQNGVAERKNGTLIEAARTMVLVTKPQNKTLYELLTGRQPIISYLRPFGCHVTILNTIDQLGKFDGKSDSGFLVGYSLHSKAFRVYNLETKRVEENLHVKFLENKPNVAGKGHAWMFDLDYLINSMNYELVSLENQANKSAGPKEANHSVGTEANDDQDANSEEIDLHDEHFVLTVCTNPLNVVSAPVSAVGPSRAFNDSEPSYPDDPPMPHLEDIYASPSAGFLLIHPMMMKEWNKKVERGVVVRNKTRLVAQGHRQEEGIDYDEVFAPVARIEAIRIFLAFASYMGFIVYQMDVKSAFLYGTIDEEVYVTEPPGFVDPKFPNKVYKVVKALYGLHQALRAWLHSWREMDIEEELLTRLCLSSEFTFFLGLQVKQKEDGIFISRDKYVAEILKKFDFLSVKTASTLIENHKPLVKDEEAANVDVHLYRSMLGSLMYLTASRPDIMFAVYACSRFQVTPKTLDHQAVKRIFRYLKGQPKLGLWYPKASSFDLEAYSDSDYPGVNLDRKSTTRGVNTPRCDKDSLELKDLMVFFVQCVLRKMELELLLLTMLHSKELASPKQTALGKDESNLLIVDSLLKKYMVVNAPCYSNEALAIPEQTAAGYA
nr:retrovirus-related Pol polyprotein from transposon TNT 1-94 [Tanacetum cinerariifolium]